MSAEDALVVFTPSGKRGRFPLGTPLLQAARSLGVDVDSVCGGRALCGRCQVLVMEGRLCQARRKFQRHAPLGRGRDRAEFLAPSPAAGRPSPLLPGARSRANLVIDVPPGSQVHRQVVRKAAEARAITLDPVVRLHYVEVREPDMHDPSGDLQRLVKALEREWELSGLTCEVSVLRTLQADPAPGGLEGHRRRARRPADHRRLAGLARAHLRARGRRRLHHHRRDTCATWSPARSSPPAAS